MRTAHHLGGAAGLLLPAVLGGLLTTGCATSSNGAAATCTLNTCTATFDRGTANATTTILGIRIKVTNVTADHVTVDVGGTPITAPVNGDPQQVVGLNISVDKVTDQQVTLKITKK